MFKPVAQGWKLRKLYNEVKQTNNKHGVLGVHTKAASLINNQEYGEEDIIRVRMSKNNKAGKSPIHKNCLRNEVKYYQSPLNLTKPENV